MTFSTIASLGVSLQGGGGSGGGGGTPGGSDTQVQFNDGGSFGGDAGLTFNKTSKAITLGGATVTTSSPVIDAAQTWNDGAVTFTGLKFNATDTASAAASLLMDLQVGGTTFFSVRKNGNTRLKGTGVDWVLDTNNFASEMQFSANGVAAYAGVNSSGLKALGFSITSVMAGNADTFLTRRDAASLRLGASDTSASATITVTIATPGVVTWSNHGLSTGSPVIFTTTGALPTGITAGTTYYAIVVNTNTFQLASSFANALAGTAITTSGSQSGTHTARRGAIAQTLSVQDTLSTGSLENIDGANLVINGSRSIGNKPGGSIIFQVAPAGSSGTAQNALATALTIGSDRVATFESTIAVLGQKIRLNGTADDKTVLFRSGNDTFICNGSYTGGNGFGFKATAFVLRNDGFVSWTATDPSAAADLILARDAANTLALRNGANAQTFNIYNTFTDASNYERLSIGWATNVLTIGTQAAGTGAIRGIDLALGATVYNVRTNQMSGPAYNASNFFTTSGYVQIVEMTAPAAPAANQVRIYAVDNGSGKTQLMALFATGAAQQIAIEP